MVRLPAHMSLPKIAARWGIPQGGAGGVLTADTDLARRCVPIVFGAGSARAGGRAVWLDEADGVH